jgi:signal transduction histidine kinase
MDLLAAMTTPAGMAIDRISLQQKLLIEKAEAQRLEELSMMKSYFVSSVSHDLKTPLTSIRMFAEILRTSRDIKPDRANEYLEIIEGESERLTRLINNVLDFAKIERGVKEYCLRPIELNECVEQVLATLQYQFRMEKFCVSADLGAGIPEVRADADAVKEACINLLTNAMKYSRDRKSIIISTKIIERSAAIMVTDQGIGISVPDRDRIFEPFYRTEDGKVHGAGGAGLGLSLVRHIMDAHGGLVEVRSTPGEGSTFTLRFPLDSGPTESTSKEPQS